MKTYCGGVDLPPLLDPNGAVSACWRGALFDGPAFAALLLLALTVKCAAKSSAPSVTVPLAWRKAPELGLEHASVPRSPGAAID